RRQWRESRTGLYSTNGGTLAVIRRSKPAADAGIVEPDLFTFGAPAAFRGYYWNWSREVFKPTMGATEDAHRLWSWVILKGYTRNRGGTVRLRSGSPFDMPEICFDSFNEGAERDAQDIQHECQPYHDAGAPLPADLAERKRRNDEIVRESRNDLAAMVDAVSFMRKVNARNPEQFVREIQPGIEIEDDSAAMEEWIKTQAWGHHCSCTCRIGSDKWREDSGQLQDREAVLSSDFRVHGVNGLRIVDASIFPKIPGYFILAPIFMASEKAADTLLQTATSAVYPSEFEAMEAAAIRRRREKARLAPNKTVAARSADRIPGDTVGLALSGGGIRSATFALGMLQTLARRNRLREIDLLSTVSGGGFIGSFLGRLFTRPSVQAASDPCGRVQEKLADTSSAPVWWLRTQANYIFATGASDLQQNLAVFLRNIIAVHLVLGTLLFTFFGLLAWLPETAGVWLSRQIWFRLFEGTLIAPKIGPITLSAWWWTPLAVLVLGLLPTTFGFWLAPKDRSYRPYPFFALLAWLVLLGGALFGLQIPHVTLFAVGGGLILLLSWCWQEVARWGASEITDNGPAVLHPSIVMHNRLSRWLGAMVFIFAALVGWVILDTLAAYFATSDSIAKKLTALMVLLGPTLPLLKIVATRAKRALSAVDGGMFSVRTARWLGLPLVILLCGIVDILAHRLFVVYPGNSWGLVVLGFTFAFSLAVGRAFDFLNLSSLHATYAARLVRTFQGASNEDRVYASSSSGSKDIKLAHPKDDVAFDQYHPEEQGGPLHFINVCVNETVDFASDRDVRERKGLPMCVTPHGVSVGRRYFAEWTGPDQWPRWQKIRRWINGMDAEDSKPLSDRRKIALKALPVSSDPNAFHVLKTKESASAESEALSLGAWTAISGAAFSTGRGRATDLGLSAFMGLANVRLGYWWDSGVREQDRPGRYPPSGWRFFKRFPITLFRMQSLLVSEWRGRYHGASRWFWYLSDGGHFEVTGLYELLRRRVPFMIVSDGGEDPLYRWGDIALLTQQTREDFGAQIEWMSPNPSDGAPRLQGWPALPGVPEWIQKWIKPDTIGALSDLGRDGKFHAALARVTYGSARTAESWILLLKPGVGADLTEDIVNYGAENDSFPQQPTFDQIFDDIQWESYRALGEQIAAEVLAD
ncbi:MAG: GMC oxidoreductase, partial [Chthoniobacterales bacterium]